MLRENVNDLLAFLAVAREQSFTKAAAKLVVSQSALSHAIRELEARLGLRLLNRTTRRVAPTEAGARLIAAIGPRFEEIDAEVVALSALRDRPAGTIRVSATENAFDAVLWPALQTFMPRYPDIKMEVAIDYGLTDIVAEHFDAGVRPGENVAKGMIAVRAPSYFARRKQPKTPHDLTTHDCINLRTHTHGGLYAWEFEKGKREFRVRVEGPLIFNSAVPLGGPYWLRPRLSAGDDGRAIFGAWRADARSLRLVSALRGLPSLLSEPTATLARLCLAG